MTTKARRTPGHTDAHHGRNQRRDPRCGRSVAQPESKLQQRWRLCLIRHSSTHALDARKQGRLTAAMLPRRAAANRARSSTRSHSALLWIIAKPGTHKKRMPDRPTAWISAAELTTLYARKRLSPVEVVDAMLERASTLQPSLNALVLLDDDSARVAAQASEDALAEGRSHCRRWMACRPRSRTRPRSKAGRRATARTPPTRLRPPTMRPSSTNSSAAGLAILGKTTTPEFGWKALTDSPLQGTTRSPWNLEAFTRRLVGRRLGADRRGRQSVQPRQRRRRLDPHSGGAHRTGRVEAELRPHRRSILPTRRSPTWSARACWRARCSTRRWR